MTEVLVLFDYEAKADDELTIRRGDVIRDVTKMDGGWWEGTLGNKRGMFPDNFVKVVSEETTKSAEPIERKEVEGSADSSVVIRQGEKMRRRCQVLFSYAPQHEDELALDVGDAVDLIEEVEEGWWRGTVHGRTGVFPSNFVAVEDAPPEPKIVAKEAALSSLSSQLTQPTISPGNISEPSSQPISEVRNPLTIKQAEPPGQTTEGHEAPSLPPKPVREMARVIFPYASQHPDELDLKEGDMVTILSKECEDKGWFKGQINGRIGVFPDNFVELVVVPAAVMTPTKPLRPERPPEKPVSVVQPSVASPLPLSPPTSSVAQAPPPASKTEAVVPEKVELPAKKEPGLVSSHQSPSQLFKSVSAGSVPKLSFSPTPSYGALPKSPLSAGANVRKEDVDLDSLVTGEQSPNLLHLTASRSAGPKRRPPSSSTKDHDIPAIIQASPPKVNGHRSSAVDEEPNNNIEEDDAELIRPQKEKTTVPWLKELSEKQESRNSKGISKDEGSLEMAKPSAPTKASHPPKSEEEKPYVPVKPSAVAANRSSAVIGAGAKLPKSISAHKLPSAPMIGGTNHVTQKPVQSASNEELQKEVVALRAEVGSLKEEVRSLQQSQGAVLSELSILRRLLQDNGFGNSSTV